MVNAINSRGSRCYASSQNDLVILAGQHRNIRFNPKPDLNAQFLQHDPVITEGLMELFLARDPFGQIELAANLVGGVDQGDLVAALSGNGRKRETGRPGTNHGNGLRLLCGPIVQLSFITGTGVHQAAGQLAREGVIQTGLITTDAGVDFVRPVFRRFQHQLCVGQKRPRHGHHIRLTGRQHLLGNIGHIDSVGRHQRYGHFPLHAGSHFGEGCARHRCGDRRHPGFMPADAGIDNGSAGLFDSFGELHDFIPGTAFFDQVQHRQPVDDDKLGPHPLPHTADDFDGQPDAVLVATAPAICALIGAFHNKLINEVAFRAHDLHAVVACPLGQHGRGHVITDLLFDASVVQLNGHERVYRRLNGGWSDQLRVIRVATGVENLHADRAAGLMDRPGDDFVLVRLFFRRHLRGTGSYRAFHVGPDTAGNDKPHAAPRTLGIECRQPLEAVRALFQAQVHGAHQGTVAKGGKAQVQGRQEMGIAGLARLQ